jgi:hypothetical protein
MKKIIPLLLINLILLNTFGFNLLLDYLIFQCKRDFSRENFYDSNKIIVLRITSCEKKNLQRIDDDEVRYKDNMYDIIKEIKKDDALYIYCVSDKKEDGLFELLFKINKNDNKNGQSEPAFTKNNLIKNYIFNDKEDFHFQVDKGRTFSYPIAIYISPIKDIVLPPPEFS